MNRSLSKMFVISGLVVALVLLAVVSVGAQGKTGDQVVIGADEVYEDDLYVAARELIIDGTVKGDVLVFAGNVIINGTVEGDLMAAAQTIQVNGVVRDDARLAGQIVVLSKGGQIQDDLSAAGFSVETKSDSQVGGNVYFGAYQVMLGGNVAGNVNGGAMGVKIVGSVDKNVDVEVGAASDAPPFSFAQFMPNLPEGVSIPDVTPGLTITDGATVAGEVKYTSQAKGNISPNAAVGSVAFEQQQVPQQEAPPSPTQVFGEWLMKQVQRLIRLLLVGLLMVWLIPGWLRRAGDALKANPWPSLGWGALSPVAMMVLFVVTTIVVLIIALLLRLVIGSAALITMTITSLVGSMIVVFLLLAFYLAVLLSGYVLAELILGSIKSDFTQNPLWSMLLGTLIVWILTLVPILGTIIGLALALFGLGATWLAIRQYTRKPAAQEAPATA